LDLTELVRQSLADPWKPLGTYVNYTPIMVGDWKGETFTDFRGRRVVTGLPTSQALLARARYAFTLALNAYLDAPKSYREAYGEEREEEKSKKKLKKEAYEEGKREEEKRQKKKLKLKIGEHSILCLLFGCLSVASLFGLRVEVEVLKEHAWNPKYAKKNRYHALIRRDDKSGTKAPLPPGALRLKVYYSIDEGRLRRLGLSGYAKALERAFVNSVKAALTVIGIGKAASRGFGRFWESPSGPSCEDVKKIIENLLRSVEDLLISAGELAEQLNPKALGDFSDGREVPHLGDPKDLCTEYLKRIPTNDYGMIIEEIAKSVLKSEWKRKARRPMKEIGSNIHTWPLGLPRRSKIRCSCPGREDFNFYGYLLASGIPEMYCERTCGGGMRVSAEEGRRVSTIWFVPVREGAAVLPLFDWSLLKVIEGDPKGKKLYHVGGVSVFVGGKPRISCDRRFVAVKEVLIGRGRRNVGRFCPPVLYGVMTPQGPRTFDNIEDAYKEALKAALNWVLQV